MTKESWDALIGGQAVERAAGTVRMTELAKQIEKLSACIEDMDSVGYVLRRGQSKVEQCTLRAWGTRRRLAPHP